MVSAVALGQLLIKSLLSLEVQFTQKELAQFRIPMTSLHRTLTMAHGWTLLRLGLI